MTAAKLPNNVSTPVGGHSSWAEYRMTVVNDEKALTIPICLPTGQEIGLLAAVTNAAISNDVVIEAFTRWRTTYRRFFLTQFTPTPERTRKWLKAILEDEHRMLFTIHAGNSLVGHYGFRDLREGSAELDNLLRGERGGHPRLMQATVRSLSRWLFTQCDVHIVNGNILADNPYALKLHVDAGFHLAEKRPLTLERKENGSRWVVGEPGHDSPSGKYYQRVILRRDADR